MEAKFTLVVKEIIKQSREASLELGVDYIGTEHLLLGIIKDRNNDACKALTLLKVNLKELERVIKVAVTPKKKMEFDKGNNIPLTKQAEKVIKITYLEARIFKSNIISSYHLLLSILKDVDNIASKVLIQFNVDYEIVKSVYHDVTDHSLPEDLFITEKATPLSLIFDTSEYSHEDIKDIICLLSEMYSNIGGDFLKISGMSQFERIIDLDIA